MAAAELQKAIVAKARGNSALDTAVKGQFFLDEVRPGAPMPYITFHFISNVPMLTFLASSSFEEFIIQFSIFDNAKANANIEDIFNKLDAVFNRGVLSYDTRKPVGCIRTGRTGPIKLEDCWQLTADYRIQYQ